MSVYISKELRKEVLKDAKENNSEVLNTIKKLYRARLEPLGLNDPEFLANLDRKIEKKYKI